LAPSDNTVCAEIAACNAAATVGAAVASALAEIEVGEVVVVDDASSDGTDQAARGADDGSGRLRIIRLDKNHGPAFARNQAIAASRSPLIAVLDADDVFLPNRFKPMLATQNWDFIADDIVFVPIGQSAPPVETRPSAAGAFVLDLAAFADGNISKRGADRGEIGFLKPVMQRAFLVDKRLAYRQKLRLGEDYDLYARALAAGARYKVVRNCGYAAFIRPDSLAARHRTEDLRRLWQADRALLQGSSGAAPIPAAAAAAVRRHARHVRAKYEQRRFLDLKAEAGLAAAALDALQRPRALPAVAGGILSDKWHGRRGRPVADAGPQPFYLLAARGAGELDKLRGETSTKSAVGSASSDRKP